MLKLEVLKNKVKEAGCDKMSYRSLGEFDLIFQCHKPDQERKNFWDTYVFRATPPDLVYSPKDKAIVNSHTLCVDAGVRIEAYPPN